VIDDSKNFLIGIGSSIAANVVWILLAAPGPLIVGLVLAFKANSELAAIIMSLSWTIFLFWFAFWFKNHREHRKDRMIAMGRLDFTIFSQNNSIEPQLVNTPSTPKDTEYVKYLLQKMCEILSYRISVLNKGASVLVFHDKENRFELLVSVGHDEPNLAHNVHKELHQDKSLAGAVLFKNHFLEITDSRKHNPNIPWQELDPNPRFVSHAGVPVRVQIGNVQLFAVAILCFDCAKPMKLSSEDRALMHVFADKIAAYWLQTATNHNQTQSPEIDKKE
jgi:hypothetical protein